MTWHTWRQRTGRVSGTWADVVKILHANKHFSSKTERTGIAGAQKWEDGGAGGKSSVYLHKLRKTGSWKVCVYGRVEGLAGIMEDN